MLVLLGTIEHGSAKHCFLETKDAKYQGNWCLIFTPSEQGLFVSNTTHGEPMITVFDISNRWRVGVSQLHIL